MSDSISSDGVSRDGSTRDGPTRDGITSDGTTRDGVTRDSATRDGITIRPAVESDIPAILGFIRALAGYERLEHECIATEEGLRKTLFGARAYAEVVFACVEGTPVGFALFFHNYSTFLAKPGIYLEDLFVNPEARGRGIGKRLLQWLAKTAVERDCGRLEWSVLDWNEPSIRFYKSLGAVLKSEWQIFRLTGPSLAALSTATDSGTG